MNDIYSPVIVDGDFNDLENSYTSTIRFNKISFDECVLIARLSLESGFRTMIWQNGSVNDSEV